MSELLLVGTIALEVCGGMAIMGGMLHVVLLGSGV